MMCVTNCIFCVMCHCNMPAFSGMLPTRRSNRLANGGLMRLHQEVEYEDGGNRALNAGNYRNTHTTAITVLKCGHSGKMKFLLGVNETFNTP